MGRGRYTPEEQAFYKAYLNSPAWQARRKARIATAGHRCEFVTPNYEAGTDVRCPRTRLLMVHHNTYERLGAEYDSDLDVYCWAHHLMEHLLWKKCAMCTQPCLENDVTASVWLEGVLPALGLTREVLDAGTVPWNRLPNKEFFLDMVPSYCPQCLHYLGKDE